MDENRARRVADALRDRGIDAHLETAGIDVFGVRVVLTGGREAIWGNEDTSALEAVVMLDGDLVGFIPEIPGSTAFDEAQVIDAIARADYDDPVGRELPKAPPPAPPLAREGGLFRRFRGGFRYDSELRHHAARRARLVARLRIVHDVAWQLADWTDARHPELGYDRDPMLFGSWRRGLPLTGRSGRGAREVDPVD